jgi:hypothetical protein
MNKRFESPDFCSTLDDLLPKLKRPARTDPLAEPSGPSRDKKAKSTEDEQSPRRDRKTSGNKGTAK